MTLVTEVVVFVLATQIDPRARSRCPLPPLGRIGRTALAAVCSARCSACCALADAPLGALVAAACVLYPALLFVATRARRRGRAGAAPRGSAGLSAPLDAKRAQRSTSSGTWRRAS